MKHMSAELSLNIVIHLYAINLKYFLSYNKCYFHMHTNVKNITD